VRVCPAQEVNHRTSLMIEIKNLTKRFGDFTAVDHLTVDIKDGEFFGLLGPNGAGKTTTISMISTVLLPTDGEIRLDGAVLDRKAHKEKRKISIVTQEFSMRQDMTMEEIMEYQGRLYYLPKEEIRRKTEELFSFSGLIEYRKRTVRHLSGGMKRKLMICRALLTEPEIILLDEPTAGMDALSRRQMWSLLREMKKNDITILLTTHYMEEAEALCDRVAFINKGSLKKIGIPKDLIRELGSYTVETEDDNGIRYDHFKEKKEALLFIENAGENAVMRATALEDVFVHEVGK